MCRKQRGVVYVSMIRLLALLLLLLLLLHNALSWRERSGRRERRGGVCAGLWSRRVLFYQRHRKDSEDEEIEELGTKRCERWGGIVV